MSASSYDAALTRVLAHEGGYSNHPDDPGGPTNFGITIADYRRYVKPGATVADIRAMTVDEARTIYRARYWDALSCDALPSGVDYAVFDYGVNSGIGRSGRVLRRLLKLPDTSSAVTDDVIRAAAAADAGRLVAAICDERLAFLRSLKTWPVFGNGWSRRVAEVRAAALAMAAAPRPPADTARVAGAVLAGGATAVVVAQQAGMPMPATVLIVVAAAAALALGVWVVRRRRNTQEA
jgi:lysozyme family protein